MGTLARRPGQNTFVLIIDIGSVIFHIPEGPGAGTIAWKVNKWRDSWMAEKLLQASIGRSLGYR